MHALSSPGPISLHLARRHCRVHSTHNAQDSFIVDIDAIQAHGIGAVDIAKLKANGYYTIASVHAATRRNLLKIKGFSEIKVDKVKDALAKCQVLIPLMTNWLCTVANRNPSLLEVDSRLRTSLVNSGSESPKSRLVANNLTPFSEGKYHLSPQPQSDSHIIVASKQ